MESLSRVKMTEVVVTGVLVRAQPAAVYLVVLLISAAALIAVMCRARARTDGGHRDTAHHRYCALRRTK